MQVVIPLPQAAEMGRVEEPVCGIPLLTRVIAEAVRAGGSRLLLVAPPGWPIARLARLLRMAVLESVCVNAIELQRLFDPYDRQDWRCIARHLEERFLWIPCDYLADRAALAGLMTAAATHRPAALAFDRSHEDGPARPMFEQPAVVLKQDVLERAPEECRVAVVRALPGIAVRPPARISDIEAELVRRSGKPTDGIYSRFNRKLCRPAVRLLTHTRITPNSVSFGGLAVAVLSGVCFAEGTWLWGIAGALLFFISGLFDEIDGMLARLKFQESAFGCWLETFVDYATYLLAFAGMTIGGYRRSGPVYLWVGAALIVGCILSFFVISVQRKLAAPTRPTDYYRRYLKALDQDSGNPISKAVRTLQFLLRKGVLIHYVLLFAVLNATPVLFFLAAFGANAAWLVTLYLNRRLFAAAKSTLRRAPNSCPVEAGVRQ